ncbi:MAG: lytic transglycosylase domain-containing protein [Anaerolineae bacterium]
MTTLAPSSARRRAPAPRASAKRKPADVQRSSLRRHLRRELMVWLAGVVFGVLLATGALGRAFEAAQAWLASARPVFSAPASLGMIAPMFSPEVRYWERDISRWAGEHDLDPNLLATVMQIESCGHPTVASHAGAQGLFQVMPFHFSTGEDMLDPDTNARRGADFLAYCMDYANGNVGLALGCYNGGPSVVTRAFETWPSETQRYYVWGTTIYQEASQGVLSSGALQAWLDAGGSGLCRRADDALAARS